MHLNIVLPSISYVHFLYIMLACTEGHELRWSLSYIKLLASLFIWCTVAGSTDMAWPLMDHCHDPLLALAWNTIITGSAIGANEFMGNAFEEALLPNHRRRSAITWAPLPAHQSREARQRRASMLVINIIIIILRTPCAIYSTLGCTHPMQHWNHKKMH